MRLYLDDDSIAGPLVRLLRQVGHDVLIPADAGLSGEDDVIQRANRKSVHHPEPLAITDRRKKKRILERCRILFFAALFAPQSNVIVWTSSLTRSRMPLKFSMVMPVIIVATVLPHEFRDNRLPVDEPLNLVKIKLEFAFIHSKVSPATELRRRKLSGKSS